MALEFGTEKRKVSENGTLSLMKLCDYFRIAVMLVSLMCREEKKNQLDATEWFIALIICSTRFGHFYAHHQDLETTSVLLPLMVCDALFAGCWRSGAGQPAMRSG